jgi:competence protein ComEC
VWWIGGLVCQHCFSLGWGGFAILVILLGGLLVGNSTAGESKIYEHRWQWGAVCAVLTVLLAMAVAEMAEWRSLHHSKREPSIIMTIAEQSQQRLVEKIDRLSLTNGEKSVLAALTIGYKKALPREVRKRFAVSGVAHILSVSGFHVAVVCSFVSLLLSVLIPSHFSLRPVRWMFTVGAIWIFVAVSGMAAASIRAGCMLTVYLTGKYLVRRRTDSYNTLAATAFCMLACHPAYLFDIGFQLSFIAVFFILYLQPPLRDIIHVQNPLLAKPWGWVTVSIAAQAGTAFLCVYYFGVFPLTFLFTNVPVIFFASLLIPVALVWLLLPIGDGFLQRVVEVLSHYLVSTTDLFGTLPWAAYPCRFSLMEVILAYAAMGSALLAIAIRKRKSQL